jgi:hypothetical protein
MSKSRKPAAKADELPVSFRLSPQIKAAAVKAAKADHRSFSNLIEVALIEYLQRRGYLKPSAAKTEERAIDERWAEIPRTSGDDDPI